MKKVDPEVYKDFRKFCIDLGLPAYKVSEILFKTAVYAFGSEDLKTSLNLSEDASILIHLRLAKEKMEKRGLPVSDVEKAILTVESFLENQKEEKQNEKG